MNVCFRLYFILNRSSLILPNDRTHGHFHYFWRRGPSVHLFALAVDAIFCLDDWLIEKVNKIIRMLVGP